MRKYFLQYLICCLLIVLTVHKMNFQKNIWVYWESDIQNAPILVKVSYQKLGYAAKKAGWQLHLVTGTNIKNFLPDYDSFADVVRRGRRQTIQQKSDILRVHLVQQNGGVWIDFVAILFQNLDWLTDDTLFEQLIINRVGKNKDDPDMLMLGQGWHQSAYSYYNSENALVCEEYFGTAIHFIAAKKKSRVMTAWKHKFNQIATMSFQQMLPDFLQKRIYLKNIDHEDVYLSGNMAYQSTVQQLQMGLDDKIGLLDIFSQRQNVYEHYKIWQLHGQVGPIALTRSHAVIVPDLFIKTREEIQQKTGKLWFYLKFPRWVRENVQSRQSRAENYFRKYPELTVEQILRKGPTYEQCQLYFIVKGSILHSLYENSKYHDDVKIPFITIQQRQKLRSHCWYINGELYNAGYRTSSVGQVTKPERQVIYANMTSLSQKLSLITIIYKGELESGYRKWQIAYEGFYIYIVLRNLICLIKIVFNFIKRKLSRRRYQPICDIEEIRKYIDISYLKTTITSFIFNWNNLWSILVWILLNVWGFMLIFAKSIMFAVVSQFYDEVQGTGKLGQWSNLLIIIFFNVLLDFVIQKFIKNKAVNTFLNLQTVLKQTRFIIYLPLCYIALLHMDVVYSFANYHNMNAVAGGMLLYTLLEEIKRRKIGFVVLNMILKMLERSKWALLGLFFVFYANRSIRYMRYDHHYIKEHLTDFLNWAFWALLFVVTLIVSLHFLRKLFFIECTQKEQQMQSSETKKSNSLQRANIYHCIVSLCVILLVTQQTNTIYESKLEYPWNFPYQQLLRVMTMLYAVCGTSIRLSTSTQSYAVFGFLSTILNFLPLMFAYYGFSFYEWFEQKGQRKQSLFVFMIVAFVVVEQFRILEKQQDQKQEESVKIRDSERNLVTLELIERSLDA